MNCLRSATKEANGSIIDGEGVLKFRVYGAMHVAIGIGKKCA